MPDAPITLAEMAEECDALATILRELKAESAEHQRRIDRRIAVMEEIARYLRREMKPL